MLKSLIAPRRARPTASEALLEPSALAAFLAVLGIALLLGAFGFEYLGGIKPCHLCLGQRLPWPIMTVVAGTAMLGLQRGSPGWLAPAAFAAAVLIAVWSTYLAGFHAGVEWKWWPGPPSCTGTGLAAARGVSFDPGQIIKCDEIAWSLFGLSLAGYNFIFSLVAVVAASLGLLKTVRRA
jgi:disulfide bond formation protein DsbB